MFGSCHLLTWSHPYIGQSGVTASSLPLRLRRGSKENYPQSLEITSTSHIFYCRLRLSQNRSHNLDVEVCMDLHHSQQTLSTFFCCFTSSIIFLWTTSQSSLTHLISIELLVAFFMHQVNLSKYIVNVCCRAFLQGFHIERNITIYLIKQLNITLTGPQRLSLT